MIPMKRHILIYCLFLNMVDSFQALFFNICLPVRIWLTVSSEYS